jgi:hypothetical protein
MKSAMTVLLGLMVLGTPSRAAAAPITINFEALAEFDPVGATFPGLTFLNATVLTAGASLNELELPPHSGSNVVFDDGGPMSINFATPVFSFGGFFTYLTPLTLTAFDTNNNVLGSVTSLFASNSGLSGDADSSPNELLEFISISGIGSVLMASELTGGSFVLDDARYNTAPSPVPEPGTLSLFLLGGGVALLRRRRAVRPDGCGYLRSSRRFRTSKSGCS